VCGGGGVLLSWGVCVCVGVGLVVRGVCVYKKKKFDFRKVKNLREKTRNFDARDMLHTKQVKKFSSEKVIFLLNPPTHHPCFEGKNCV
jgi:hypothetical protein